MNWSEAIEAMKAGKHIRRRAESRCLFVPEAHHVEATDWEVV